MKSIHLFFALLFLIACSSDDDKGPQVDAATTAYMEEFFTALESKSAYRKTIDWANFRTETYKYVQNSSQINEGIMRGLTMLNDPLARAERNKVAITTPNAPCDPGTKWSSTFDESIGYIIGFWNDDLTDSKQASSFQLNIELKDSEDLKGWVIDLRITNNAKFWPMLAGLGPILGDGTAGYFVDPDGSTSAWSYADGKVSKDNTVVYDLHGTYYDIISGDKKVAVIVGPGTTAAGEALALSFRGRANTKLFGTTTCGYATQLDSVQLSDKATIWFASTFAADRTKSKQSPVVPDETIADYDALNTRIVEWLNEP